MGAGKPELGILQETGNGCNGLAAAGVISSGPLLYIGLRRCVQCLAMMSTVKTPCIGICSTGIGDTVCRGCKRFSHEVIHWNAYTADERGAVLSRLEQLLASVVGKRFYIRDEALLKSTMQRQNLVIDEAVNALCWVQGLLRAKASRISALQDYGVGTHAAYRNTPLTQLRDDIERDFDVLSEAHYERYIAPGLASNKLETG